jgi:hypothetical protein
MDSDDSLEGYPGILIPCYSVEDLQKLTLLLYEEGILGKNSAFLLKNVPDNMLEILNYPEYFDEITFSGIEMIKGQLKKLEVPTEDLL